ncbi:MAG: hypothetical protein WA843_04930, partial [Candidatus Saccharimonadales bacterium]
FSLVELGALVAPFVVAAVSLTTQHWLIGIFSSFICILLIVFYARIVNLTYRRFLWRGLWLLPFATVYDVVLLNYSMWQYEFSEVIWKGRNICIPIMRTTTKPWHTKQVT